MRQIPMKMATIAPISLMEQLQRDDEVHMALAHLVTKFPIEYGGFYRERSIYGQHVILDNSADEMDGGTSLTDLFYAIDMIQPTEVVLPDRQQDKSDTIQKSTEAISEIRIRWPKLKVMAVPQGAGLGEWNECLEALLDLAPDSIGVAKNYSKSSEGLWEYARLVRYFPVVHFLGQGRDMVDQIRIGRMYPNFRSMDTAKPIVYALHGLELNPMDIDVVQIQPKYPGRPDHYFELTEKDIDLKLARRNLQVVRTALEAKEDRRSGPCVSR